jgi:MFS family permease
MWTLGLAFSALFNVLVSLVTNPWQFFFLRYGHVIADAFMLVASLQIISVLFPRGRLGGSMGLVAMVQTVGILVGSLLAGGIADWGIVPAYWQLRLPFVVAGTIVWLGVGVQLALRERFCCLGCAEEGA